ncbi:MAG: prolyl oligopeptidase family serine peptidase [Simkaniaceae bacterium]|nr:prolyl oligopeptidase family serine peptidase [Simkaniaceae bacterium]
MNAPETAPYGTWASPITSAFVARVDRKLGFVEPDGDALYVSESRPEEKGRVAIVSLNEGRSFDIVGEPYNVRTSVHEYGGKPYTVRKGTIYFSHFADHSLYVRKREGTFFRLTRADDRRYADLHVDLGKDLLYAVEERHFAEREPVNALVAIRIGESHEERVITLSSCHDFYSSPIVNREGTEMAFLAWDHPRMPWDGTELYVGDPSPSGEELRTIRKVAGGAKESIFQPRFAPDGTLFFVSDRTGFWNLYKIPRGESGGEVFPCLPKEAEFGVPQWVFGISRYDFLLEEGGYRIVCAYTVRGVDGLGIYCPKRGTFDALALPFTAYDDIRTSKRGIYFQAASGTRPKALYLYAPETRELLLVRSARKCDVDSGHISVPETIAFPTENDRTAFGFYYPPKNGCFQPPTGERPPLIVEGHGGPSSQARAVLRAEVLFWTSRGFAFLSVNYGGSTGYGRTYRERLNGMWGIVDVEDCINGAKYLFEQGLADPERTIIRGSSAGGYTVLVALTLHDFFRAGASYYGVSDLVALLPDTHKFESRYADTLIGPYPAKKERYERYSPILHVDRLSVPVIFFQGDRDKIVPPDQSSEMFASLKKRGIPTEYLLFEGEGHGFRQAEHTERALEAELRFYAKVFALRLRHTSKH